MKQWKKYIPGCVAGNILELYQFIIYGYFSSIIGAQFFPTENSYSSLMIAFGVFATGSLVRPFSSLVFGFWGDTFGRKYSLIISISLMSIATLLIGLLPTYHQIGLLAPAMLISCRIAQGLSMTSEEIGAALFLIENAPENQRGFASSFILGSVYIGLLLGSLMAALLFSVFPSSNLEDWAWRIPFILGGFAGILTLLIRIKQPESEEFHLIKKQHATLTNPLVALFKNNLFTAIRSTFLFSLTAVAVYLFAVYIPNVIKLDDVESSKKIIMSICSFGFAITFVVSILTGKWIDKIGEKTPVVLSCLGFIALSYPLFTLFSTGKTLFFLLGYIIFAILLGLIAGSIMLAAIKPFPVGVRFSGGCFAFNLSMSVFGGTAPMLALYLHTKIQLAQAPSLLLIFSAILTLVALLFPRRFICQ
jgi:MHS family proline/betaine transporter-like MFS transporter